MMNTITIDAANQGEFFGPLASKYSYKPELRKRLDALYQASLASDNRYFVLDGDVCKAAQSTLEGAMTYMQDGFVLVDVLLKCRRDATDAFKAQSQNDAAE